MYRQISNLILYSDLGEDSILLRLAEIFEDFEKRSDTTASLIRRVYREIKKLLDLADEQYQHYDYPCNSHKH